MAKLSSILVDDQFTTVRSDLVRLLGGNANAAIVLSRINFRANPNYRNAIEDVNDQWWWRATLPQIAEETGLTVDQVRFAIKKLIDGRWIEVTKHQIRGNSDHTWSYRIVDRELPDEARHADLGTVPDRIGNSPRSDLGTVPDLPSVKKTEERLSGDHDFEPSEEDLKWASEKTPGLDVLVETELFNANMRSKGIVYVRTDMAWRSWMIKSLEFLKRVGEHRSKDRSSSRSGKSATIASIEALRKQKTAPPATEHPSVNGPRKKSWSEQWQEESQEQLHRDENGEGEE